MSNSDDGGFKIIGADPTQKVIGVDVHQNEYEREIRSEPRQENRGNDTLRDERHSTPISITTFLLLYRILSVACGPLSTLITVSGSKYALTFIWNVALTYLSPSAGTSVSML